MSSAHRYLLLASIACLLPGAASAQESPDTNRQVAGGAVEPARGAGDERLRRVAKRGRA